MGQCATRVSPDRVEYRDVRNAVFIICERDQGGAALKILLENNHKNIEKLKQFLITANKCLRGKLDNVDLKTILTYCNESLKAWENDKEAERLVFRTANGMNIIPTHPPSYK